MINKAAISIAFALSTFSAAHAADNMTVKMNDLESGKAAGTVEISKSDYGVVFTPSLSGVARGGHGFHVHENGSCESKMKDGKKVLGGAAGGHYDPEKTGKHGYPWTEDNHRGDLPLLYVDKDGNAQHPVLAPRLEMDELKGLALMIHAGGDNYSDSPEKLGGGGARVVCGVIK
ncbi:superoxide dismutase family protein [Alteromonas pelagimontana]|uniref:Superoxide dismutase [Cu-Zn] n=1 Tax=Alteromonas pelagimontana TaxID=1858656 RepID=A0A6M4MBG0_9ALTE|nr:superoxide dismutase family protein [Alteromonas pelagimontana]QJR80493.1 superoxide dismutase family protein [Alteromonas pelagimontana]